MPRLATVVPNVVSPTVRPMTRPKVKMLLTSGRPNSVVLANSASRCKGCGFIVNVVNSTLSISVTVRVTACSNTCPSVNSSKYRPAIRHLPRIIGRRLLPLEYGTALFVESGDRLFVIFGEGTARLMRSFELEHRLERLGLGGEQVALHVAKRDTGAVGDAPGQRRRLGLQFIICNDAVNDA